MVIWDQIPVPAHVLHVWLRAWNWPWCLPWAPWRRGSVGAKGMVSPGRGGGGTKGKDERRGTGCDLCWRRQHKVSGHGAS
jgi:hypothetical protein